MTMTEASVRGGCPGWMKLLLILSLAINVAVVGVVVGHGVRGEERGARGADRMINWLVGMVPDERRDFAIAHFAVAQDEIAAARADRARNIGSVLAAMRAEPFDPQALNAALEKTFDGRSRKVIRERLITLLEQFTPAERTLFADRFAQRLDDRAQGKG